MTQQNEIKAEEMEMILSNLNTNAAHTDNIPNWDFDAGYGEWKLRKDYAGNELSTREEIEEALDEGHELSYYFQLKDDHDFSDYRGYSEKEAKDIIEKALKVSSLNEGLAFFGLE